MAEHAAAPPIVREHEHKVLPVPDVWTLDPGHSILAFDCRHMMLSRLRGWFASSHGQFHIEEEPEKSWVEVTIDAPSLQMPNPAAQEAVKSELFLDVVNHPTLHFRSTGVDHVEASEWRVAGDLTIKGTTREVVLDSTYVGVLPSPPEFGGRAKLAFSATGEFDRRDFGLDWNVPLPGGGWLVGNRVGVTLDVEAVLGDTDDEATAVELDGVLTTTDGGYEVRFERTFDTTVERLWAVVSEPDLLEGWLGGPVKELELAVGGNVEILIHPKGPATVHGEVLRVEPHEVLELTWNVPAWRNIPDFMGTVMRWEVRPDPDGATLVLTHSLPEDVPWHVHSMLGAWHLHLDAIPAVITGDPIPRFSEADFFGMRERYFDHYGPVGGAEPLRIEPGGPP